MLLQTPTQVKMVDEKGNITHPWLMYFTALSALINKGIPVSKNNPGGVQIPQSVTITIAGLTSLTFTNGILTGRNP